MLVSSSNSRTSLYGVIDRKHTCLKKKCQSRSSLSEWKARETPQKYTNIAYPHTTTLCASNSPPTGSPQPQQVRPI